MDIRRDETSSDAAAHPIYQSWLGEQRRRHKTNYGRRLPVRRVREAGVYDQWRLAHGVAEWLTRHCANRRISICVTDAPTVNAWAFAQGPHEDESVIVITRRGLLALQRLNFLVAAAARGLRDSTEAPLGLLGALGSRQLDDRMTVAIAQLVMSAAMLFLLFHEAAHLLRGHLVGAVAEDETGLQASRASTLSSMASTAPIVGRDLYHPNVYSRTIEFDADVQAFYWTRLHLDHIDTALLGDELGSESREVFRLLLSTPEGRRWVALAAGLCFHVAFSEHASLLVRLEEASHPSRHERVELALLSDAAIATHNGEEPLFLWECMDFVSRMICEDALDDTPVLEQAALGLTVLRDQPLSVRLKAASDWLGLPPDEASAELMHQQRLALMKSMRSWEPVLASRQLSSTMPILPWWRMTQVLCLCVIIPGGVS